MIELDQVLNRSKCDRGWFPLDDAHVPVEKEKKYITQLQNHGAHSKTRNAYACLIDDQVLHIVKKEKKKERYCILMGLLLKGR